jgi:hypothetical protein
VQVENQQVGLQVAVERQGLSPTASLADNRQITLTLEQASQASARKFVIVDQNKSSGAVA